MRLLLPIVMLLSAMPADGTEGPPPLGTILVGADPLVSEPAKLGAEGWNRTGIVRFVVEPTGCGTGDVTICVYDVADPYPTAGYYDDERTIVVRLDRLWRFTPAIACHEFGHALGLGGDDHRHNYLSCMSSENEGRAAPDAVDLAKLGFPNAPVAPAVETASCPASLALYVDKNGTFDGTWIPMGDGYAWFDFAQGRITQVAHPDPGGWVVETLPSGAAG